MIASDSLFVRYRVRAAVVAGEDALEPEGVAAEARPYTTRPYNGPYNAPLQVVLTGVRVVSVRTCEQLRRDVRKGAYGICLMDLSRRVGQDYSASDIEFAAPVGEKGKIDTPRHCGVHA